MICIDESMYVDFVLYVVLDLLLCEIEIWNSDILVETHHKHFIHF